MYFENQFGSESTIEKIRLFNDFQNVDAVARETEIQKICNAIFNDKTINNPEILKSVLSFVSNDSSRDEICHRLGIDNIILTDTKESGQENEKSDIDCFLKAHCLDMVLNEAEIKMYLEMPKEKRATILKYVPNMFTTNMNVYNMKDVLKVVSGLSEEKISEIAKCVQALRKEMVASEKIAIIKILSNIPEDKIADVVKWAPTLFTKDTHPYIIKKILVSLAALPEGKIADVVECIQQLDAGMSANAKLTTLEIFLNIPEGNISRLVKFIPTFTVKLNNSLELNQIISSLGELPEDKIADVLQFLQKIGNELTPGTGRIIDSFSYIPHAKITDIAKYVPLLCPMQMDVNEMIDVLETAAKIPEGKMASMVKFISLISDGAAVIETIEMINALIEIPLHELIDQFDLIQKLFHPGITVNEKLKMIKAFADLPKGDRVYAVACLQAAQEMDRITIDDKVQFLQGIMMIPKEGWMDSIHRPLPYSVLNSICSFNPLLLLNLLKNKLKTADDLEGLENLIEARKFIVNEVEYKNIILASLQDKFNAFESNLDPSIVNLAHYVFNRQREFGLPPDHPLINHAIKIIIKNDPCKIIVLIDTHSFKISSVDNRNFILDSLSNELKNFDSDQNLSRVNLANFVFARQEDLGLLPDHPLVNQAIEMIIKNDPQNKNRQIRMFKTLLDLSKQLNPATCEIDLNLFEDCKNFIRKDMNLYEVAEVVSLLQSIQPQSERKSVISLTKELIDETMTWKDQAAILLSIASFRPQEREDKLELAKKYFSQEMNRMQKILILHCLNKGQMGFELIEKLKCSSISYEEEFGSEKEMTETSDLVNDALPFVPIASTSIFANTDLVVFKDDFKGVLPLNGIKEAELVETEELIKKIIDNQTNIKIDNENKKFEREIQGSILTLLTRSIGRKLIHKVIENSSVPRLPIVFGKETQVRINGDKILDVNVNINQETTAVVFSDSKYKKMYKDPNFIALGHELIHVSHFPHMRFEATSKGMEEYDDLEEQITITGYSQNRNLPPLLEEDFSSLSHGEQKYPDLFLEEEEDWQATSDGAFESFDGLNARNLHAAFANLESGFQPRVGHGGKDVRSNIIFNINPLDEAYRSIVSDIRENYISSLQKLGVVPTDIQKFGLVRFL